MPPANQPSLFDHGPPMPEGFRYQSDLITVEQERQLLEQIEKLPFKEFEFQGFTGKRRVVSFGWKYDFIQRELQKAEDMPPFLVTLRERINVFGRAPQTFQHVLVTEYSPGAAIGWHKDKKVFDDVVGLSLGSACRFRFRRERDGKWERAAIIAEPRSGYLLSGPSRTEWEHSIPAVDQLRYSITYRSFVERS